LVNYYFLDDHLALTHQTSPVSTDPDNPLPIGSHYDFNWLDRISIGFWFKHKYVSGETTPMVETIVSTNTTNLFKFVSTNDDSNILSRADFLFCGPTSRSLYANRRMTNIW